MGLLTGAPAGLPLGHPDAVRGARPRVPGRHRRPVRRHARRPDARARARGAGGGGGLAGLPDDARHPGAAARPSSTGSRVGAASAGSTPRRVLPTVGSKELVAFLPSLLGLGAGDVVLHPAAAYPTYDVGARLAGATPGPDRRPGGARWRRRDDVRLVWLNSPGNPDGSVLGVDELRAVVDAARALGRRPVVVASDECYAELAWDEPWASSGVPSILDPRVTGGDLTGLLAVYSLSKQSNLAGYRASFVAGDPVLVARLLEVRKHAGMIVPGPVQAATTAALCDDEHVADAARPSTGAGAGVLRAAFEGAGYAVDRSHAGLYLWVRPESGGQDSWATVADLAGLGILVAPGAFYGDARARPRGADRAGREHRGGRGPPLGGLTAPGVIVVTAVANVSSRIGHGTVRAGTVDPGQRGHARAGPAGPSSAVADDRTPRDIPATRESQERNTMSDVVTAQVHQPVQLIVDGQSKDLPIVTATEGNDGIVVSSLLRDTGPGHRRPGLHEHRLVRVADHLHRRRRGHPALPRVPDRAAGRALHVPRGRVPAHPRRAADAERARRVRGAGQPPHAGARGLPHVHGDVPAQRAPDGGHGVGDQRAVHVLPGVAGPVRPGDGRAGHGADPGQDADHHVVRAPRVQGRAAALPGLLARVRRGLPADDVRGPVPAVRGGPGRSSRRSTSC